MKTKLIYGSQLIKTYSCDHERKGVKPFLDLQTNNRKININELVAIFYWWLKFWRLNYSYYNELTSVNTMSSAGTIIICLN